MKKNVHERQAEGREGERERERERGRDREREGGREGGREIYILIHMSLWAAKLITTTNTSM